MGDILLVDVQARSKMVASTRSGQLKKDESTSNFRSGNTSRKEKDVGSSIVVGPSATNSARGRSASGKENISRYLTASGSSTDNLSTSRKPAGQVPEKTKSPSPGTRRSTRQATCEPLVSADVRDSERVKERSPPSPLRRSKRIRRNSASGSGLIGSKRSSRSLDKKIQNNMHDGGKSTVVDIVEENKKRKMEVKPANLISKKKKRLDARSYRAWMKSQKKSPKDISVRGSKENGNGLCHVESLIPKAGDHKDGQKLEELCNENEMIQEHNYGEHVKAIIEGSSPSSRELANRSSEDYREGESEREQKICSSESEYEGSQSATKCIENPLQSSLRGASAKNIDNDSDRSNCFAHGDLQTPGPAGSISEGKISGAESDDVTNLDYHSAVSVASVNPEVLIQEALTAEAILSPSFGNKDQIIQLCKICCKQQRATSDLKGQRFCSCDSNFISCSQGGCETSTVPESYKDEVVTSSEKGAAAKKFEHNGGEKADESQIEDVSLTDVPNLFPNSLTIEEDRGRLEVTDDVDASWKPNTQQNRSSWAIQSSTHHNACVICKQPGLLLSCDGQGCKRSYHLSCIDPPLKEIPPGNWYCLYCMRKKIEVGFHAVSEGIESVLDVRLLDSTYSGVTRKEKHYLVKYKGLAHVHNRWIPEKKMLVEAPSLLGKFHRRNQREKVSLTKEEWTVPQRLLQKRLLMPPELADECFSVCVSNTAPCYYEWLVKWTGLGYEHATWEFENSPFLCSPEATSLRRDFENRHRMAKKSSDPSKSDKVKLRRLVPLSQLPTLPVGCPTGLDGDYLNSVNRFRECWHKAQSVVFLEEQERIIKVTLFILSLESHVSCPFLIISTASSLSLWESEFRRLAPSVNAVVYSGDKDVRKMIRSLEFYEEGDCVKFKVLLSLPDVIVEDYKALDFVGWEAVIVDDCQHLRVSKHLEQLTKFSSDFRLLLFNGQLKDNVADYLNLLSFLDPGRSQCSADGVNVSCNTNNTELAIVKDRLSKYIMQNSKADYPKFLEYWVPVELSTVQLEQYCATLISNFLSLRSYSKIDHVGVLRDILISQRKCCDHPYLVDDLLQARLTKDVQAIEYLDIGVKASGKLQLLDRILQDMKDQGLRVVILFQLVGRDGKSTIGDILDDFLRQRFGVDSYERVDSGLSMSKKQSALNMFNSKENGRFMFLIENRACLPSIRLSSVDAVIIFSSDWNPTSDLRALQKINIESHFGYVKVFRLYSSFTVEEKILILAKQDKTLDGSIPNISCGVSQSLLSWGASYIFSKLDEFHRNEIPKICSVSFSEKSILNDVLREVLSQLSQNAGQKSACNCSIISKVQQNGATYSKDILLLGEKEMPLPAFQKKMLLPIEESPHIFWSNLLSGRYPRWMYISEPSQRARRKPQCHDASIQQPEVENEEARKKRRKVANSSGGPKMPNEHSCTNKSQSFGSPKETITHVDFTKGPGVQKSKVHKGQQCAPSLAHKNDEGHNQDMLVVTDDTSADIQSPPESEERRKLHSSQRNLHLLLKPELEKLCETLQLSVDVRNMAQLFLKYIMNNHRVGREPETILQAFKISLCWRAASVVKPKLDHRTSLLIAKKYLNYECTEEEAESVHKKLQMLKKKFKSYVSREDVELNSRSQGNESSPRKEIEGELLHKKNPSVAAFDQQALQEDKMRESRGSHSCSKWQLLPEPDEIAALEMPPIKHLESLKDEIMNKRITLIEKTCSKRIEKVLQNQQLEVEEFNSFREREKAMQQKGHELESDLLCAIHFRCEVKKEKLNLLKQEFSNRMEKFEEHMKGQRRKLANMQVEARNKEQQIRDCWLAEANIGRLAESFDIVPLADTGFTPEAFKDFPRLGTCDGFGSALSICGLSTDHENSASVACGRSDSNHQDNMFVDFPPPTSRGTAEDLSIRSNLIDHLSINNASCDVINACDGVSMDTEAVMVTLPYRHNLENNTECALASTSFEIHGASPSTQAVSSSDYDNVLPSHQVPLNGHEGPLGPETSQTVTAATSQSSDSVPAQVYPSADDLIVQGSVPLSVSLQVSTDLSLQEVNTSRANTVLSRLGGDEHGGTSYSTNYVNSLVQGSIGAKVSQAGQSDSLNLQTTVLDGIMTGQDMNSSHVNTLPSVQESFETIVSQTEESDQLITQTTILNGLDGGLGLNSPESMAVTISQSYDSACTQVDTFSNNPRVSASVPSQVHLRSDLPSSQHGISCMSRVMDGRQELSSGQERVVSVLQLQTATDLPSGQCDTVRECIPVQNRDGSTCDTCYPTNQTQVSEQQSFGTTASQPAHFDQLVGRPTFLGRLESGQGLNYSQALLQPFSTVPQAALHDPLQNELSNIRRQEDKDTEMCEKEKQRLKLELEKELDEVRKKYDSLLNDLEKNFSERKKTLAELYKKVYLNRVLAEEFRSKFSERQSQAAGSSSRGTRPSFTQQLLHASQPHIAHREALASTSAATSVVSPGFVRRVPAAVSHFDLTFSSARSRIQGPVVSPASSSSPSPPVQVVHHSSALFSSNPPVRHPSPVLAPRGFQVGIERAPAPHLHSFRANASTSLSSFPLRPGGGSSLNQQQQLASHPTSSVPMRVASVPLSVGGTQRHDTSGTRPAFGVSQCTLSSPVDVRDECAGANQQNSPALLEADKSLTLDDASIGTGPPPPILEAAGGAPSEVICLLDD